MKTSTKIIYGAAAVAVASLLIHSIRKSNTKRRIAEIADEGYETAVDILHPNTNSRFKKLQFGPVLPS